MNQKHEEDYHHRVMSVADRLTEVLRDHEDDYDVVINALLTVLALAGKDSTMSQTGFCATVASQLDDMMTHLRVEEHPIQ